MSTATMTPEAATKAARSLTIGLARSREELLQAFRLVFESYYQAGLTSQHPSRIRLTPHHLLPTTEVLVAKRAETVTSTLSLFGDGYLGLPMESMYPQEIKQMRLQGYRMAELGSLADRRGSQERFIDTFAQLGRLVAQTAKQRGIDTIIAATHPRHARLYKRVMGFDQVGELSDCPYANGNPAVALCLRFNKHIGTPLHERYFGNPIGSRELVPYRWEPETRQYFRRLLERDNKIADGAAIQGYYNWAVITGKLTDHMTITST